MAAAARLLTVILVCVFLSAKAYGFKGDSCPDNAIIDLTGVALNSSEDFSRELWIENGTNFGCLCDFVTCIPFCCPVGFATTADGCVADILTILRFGHQPIPKGFHFLIGNPCDSMWKDFTSRTNSDYYRLKDGSLLLGKVGNRVHLGSFCMFREPDSQKLLVLTCQAITAPGANGTTIWILVCMTISVLFMLATFIVYSVVPELKNLQGWMVRSYLASYIGCVVSFSTVSVILMNGWGEQSSVFVDVIIAGTAYYFGVACIFWLNVMSFDIWNKFRNFRSSPAVNIRKRERVTFARYSIYAWITPVVPISIFSIWLTWLSPPRVESVFPVVTWFTGAPIIAIFVCNTCFYTMTALRIRQCKKETAHMVGGANKHHQENQKWFSVYLKLFIMMGCPILVWGVRLFWYNVILALVVYSMEPLISVLVFLMFVWKDDVRSSFRKQFTGMLRRLGSCLQSDSTPVI